GNVFLFGLSIELHRLGTDVQPSGRWATRFRRLSRPEPSGASPAIARGRGRDAIGSGPVSRRDGSASRGGAGNTGASVSEWGESRANYLRRDADRAIIRSTPRSDSCEHAVGIG